MTVYVDDMQAGYGRMKMCHMVADTDDELHVMADQIGVARKWHQKPGTPQSHYDICLSKRALAVQFGAQEVTRREAVMIIIRKREAFTSNAGVAGPCSGKGRTMNNEPLSAPGQVGVEITGFADLEQAAFDAWLQDKLPSGDVESVQRQWLESQEYAELRDAAELEWKNDVQAAFGGIVQTPQG